MFTHLAAQPLAGARVCIPALVQQLLRGSSLGWKQRLVQGFSSPLTAGIICCCNAGASSSTDKSFLSSLKSCHTKSLQQLPAGSREIVVKASGNPFDVGQTTGRDGNEVLGELQSPVSEISISGADRAAHCRDSCAVSSTLTNQKGEEMADEKLTGAPDFSALGTWLWRGF